MTEDEKQKLREASGYLASTPGPYHNDENEVRAKQIMAMAMAMAMGKRQSER